MCKLELQLKPLGSMVHPYTFCHPTAYENKLPFLLYLAVYHSRPCPGVVALLLQLPHQQQLLQICIRNTVMYYCFAIAIRFNWKLKPSTTPAQRNLIVTTLGFLRWSETMVYLNLLQHDVKEYSLPGHFLHPGSSLLKLERVLVHPSLHIRSLPMN